jgi:hypothetical protein
MASVKVKVDGVDALFVEVLAFVKCRPGKPLDGCQGRGFSVRRDGVTESEVKKTITLCGCAVNGYRKAHAERVFPVLSPARAQQVDAADERLSARLGRKSAALVEARAELAGILEKVGQAVGSLADEAAIADAVVLRARARADEANESIRNLAERIRLTKKLHEEALEEEAAAREAQAGAQADADRLRAAIETAKGAHAAEERQARARVAKLERRVQTFVAYHPEAATTA